MKYSKEQILEAIRYWDSQLKNLDENSNLRADAFGNRLENIIPEDAFDIEAWRSYFNNQYENKKISLDSIRDILALVNGIEIKVNQIKETLGPTYRQIMAINDGRPMTIALGEVLRMKFAQLFNDLKKQGIDVGN